MALAAELFAVWLFGFSALISIINPLGGALVFHGMTRWLTEAERARLARAIAINSFIVLIVALFVGVRVLGFFGISLEALRLAGGLAVAVAGWRMLNEETDEARQQRDARAPAALDTAPLDRMAFFPLTLPLTTGPGTIAACIALAAERRAAELGDILVSVTAALLIALAVGLSVWVAYANAAALARRLGPTGMLIAAKLAAFLLLCIGAQIMLTGATDALRPIFAAR
ncbi:MarC family protein [Falsiroseomonas oryziterrae]|uniref:MarC family protein n=1 Tax=Falsiroseomonas oryziterrae TaxID=2911368 RepID=UPI001F00E423|nr:MarC family protein [Roseomonas sp. NPKOSM-4]